MDKIKALQVLNLSPSEAKTYLAVLEAGELKVAEVAKLIGNTRMAGYLAVRGLKEKGLLAEFKKNGKKYASASDPEQLVINLERENAEQDKAINLLLPDLKTLFSTSKLKPSVRVFQGLEGLKTVYEDTLKTMKEGDNYVAFGSVREAFSTLSDYLDDYVARRIERKISFRGIAPVDEMTKEFIREDKERLREVRLVSADKFPFKNEINIYSNKVAILSFRDQIGIIIESAQIADTQRAIFELAWLGTEKANETNRKN